MENIMDKSHRLLAIAVAHHAANPYVRGRDHLDIDLRLSQLAEHGRRYFGLIHQADPNDTQLCHVLVGQNPCCADRRSDLLEQGSSDVQIIALHCECDVIDRAALMEGLDYHVDTYMPVCQCSKDLARDSRLVRYLEDGQPCLIPVQGNAAYRPENLHLACSSQNGSVVLGVKCVPDSHRQAVIACQCDRSRMQHLGPDPRHLEHLVV